MELCFTRRWTRRAVAPALGLLFLLSSAAWVPAQPDDATRLFRRMTHFIANDAPVELEIGAAPLPFLDWTLVRPGFVEYVARDSGEIVPLSESHPYEDPEQIRAIPVASASGLEIQITPGKIGQTFSSLIAPSFPWEEGLLEANTLLYDEAAGLYRVWYETRNGIAYAESNDFQTWTKPLKPVRSFGSHPETNLIGVVDVDMALVGELQKATEARPGASGAFFVDPSAPESERFKSVFLAHSNRPREERRFADDGRPISAMTGPGSTVLFGAVSADGIAWKVLPEPLVHHDADTQTVAAFDSITNKYVAYTRQYEFSRRSIALMETEDFSRWPVPETVLAPGPSDSPFVDFYANAFSFYPGNPAIRLLFCLEYDRFRDNGAVRLASSRGGGVVHFLPGDPIAPPAPPNELGAGFMMARPGLVRTRDRRFVIPLNLWTMPHKFPRKHLDQVPRNQEQYLLEWREDRLAAVESRESGTFHTPHLRLSADSILLNFSTSPEGRILVEARDENFAIIPGKSFAQSDPLVGDRTDALVAWNGDSDLSAHRGRILYLQFKLEAARVYAIRGGGS